MYQPTDEQSTDSNRTYTRTGDETATEAIVTVVADATNQSPLDIRPLGEVVDTDAVNTILDGTDDESFVGISFEYAGKRVYATSSEVTIDEII